jgi:hypothetical protein
VFQTMTDFLWSYLWLDATVFFWIFLDPRLTHRREHRLQHSLRNKRFVQILCFPWITVCWLEKPTRAFYLRFPWGYVVCSLLCAIALAALAGWAALRHITLVSEGIPLILWWMILLHLLVSFTDDGGGHHRDDDIPPDDPTTPTGDAAERWLRQQSLTGRAAK